MLSKSITTKRYDGDIVSFSFHSGSYFGGYGEYEIKNEGGELKFSARGYNGKDVNVDKTISGEYLDRIDAVLKKYDVASWDGFNESDDDVMDGEEYESELTKMAESQTERGVNEISAGEKNLDNEFSKDEHGITKDTPKSPVAQRTGGKNTNKNAKRNEARKNKKKARQNKKKGRR